jgi:hypothetical protein
MKDNQLMSQDMILDLSEIAKSTFDAARKLDLIFDTERCFVTKRSDRDFATIYMHIGRKFYHAPLLISITLIDQDALKQLADSIPDIEPRNIMRIYSPRLWQMPSVVSDAAD